MKPTFRNYGHLASLAKQYRTLVLDAQYSNDEERNKRNTERFDSNAAWLHDRCFDLFVDFINSVMQRREYLTLTHSWTMIDAHNMLAILDEQNIKTFAYEYTGSMLMETLSYFESNGWRVSGLVYHKNAYGAEFFGLRIVRKQNRKAE